MIKLTKLPEPTVLVTNKVRWTQEYKAAKEAKAANLEELKMRYRHPEIKEQILRETHEKCAYCESKIRHTYPGDIEHIKPKTDFADDIFEWENLTLGCGECNRRKLANYDEEIGILNPYQTDPTQHLYALGSLIFPRPGDDIGKLAYELFELNRVPLVERRTDRLDKLRLEVDNYVTQKNELLKKLYKRKLEREMDSSNEYSMVSRAFVSMWLKPERRSKVIKDNAAD